MNKTDITNLITAIDDGGLNTAAEVRAILSELRDNGYGDAEHEIKTNVITNLVHFAQTADGNWFDLYICKQGRKVSVKGILINKQSVTTSSTSFFEITDSDYLPNSTVAFIIGNASNDMRGIKMYLVSNKLTLSGSALAVGQNIYIDFEYLTQD